MAAKKKQKNKPKLGRPPASGNGRPRLDRYELRLFTAEKDKYKKAAKAAGLPLSEWMRNRLTNAADLESMKTARKKKH